MKTIQRTFIPGSKWIYFKIYTGTKTVDNILIQYIFPIVKKMLSQQKIEKWFFIRYIDSDFHLRIRLLMTDEHYFGEIVNVFYFKLKSLVERGMIWKIQLDTYNREIERYKNYAMEQSESFFFIDSECILNLLKNIEGKNENFRWMIALRMIDELLSNFSYSLQLKMDFMYFLSQSFKEEFGFNKYNSKQFNSKFRENKKNIELALNDKIQDEEFKKIILPIKIGTKKMKAVVLEINSVLIKNKINNGFLIERYMHMMLNRLFCSKNRIHELIVYDFMYRYYKSKIAKNNNVF